MSECSRPILLIMDSDVPVRFTYEELTTFDYVCISGLDNKEFQDSVDIETFLNHGHIMLTTVDSDSSVICETLAKRGLARDIKLRVPHYAAAISAAEASDLIFTLPRLLVPHAEKHYQLKISELPIPSPTRHFYQVWQKIKSSDPVHGWVRKVVHECFE